MILDVRFIWDGGRKQKQKQKIVLCQNSLVSVQVGRYVTGTHENVTLSSQLTNVGSGITGVSHFVNDRTGNVFFNRLGTDLDLSPSPQLFHSPIGSCQTFR